MDQTLFFRFLHPLNSGVSTFFAFFFVAAKVMMLFTVKPYGTSRDMDGLARLDLENRRPWPLSAQDGGFHRKLQYCDSRENSLNYSFTLRSRAAKAVQLCQYSCRRGRSRRCIGRVWARARGGAAYG